MIYVGKSSRRKRKKESEGGGRQMVICSSAVFSWRDYRLEERNAAGHGRQGRNIQKRAERKKRTLSMAGREMKKRHFMK